MRFILMLAGLILMGLVLYKQYFLVKPAPPPPPPPPAIELAPAPILSQGEIQKVMESTQDVDPYVRWEALKFLTKLDLPQTDAIMAEMLAKDADPNLRKNIITELLKFRTGPRNTELLLLALRDEAPEVRIAALQMLADIGDPATTASEVSNMLKDLDGQVRLNALNTLNALQNKRNDEVRKEQERREAEEKAALNSKGSTKR